MALRDGPRRRIRLITALAALLATGQAAALEYAPREFPGRSGLRLNVYTPIEDIEIVRNVEPGDSFTAEVAWVHSYPIQPLSRFRLSGSPALAVVIQSAEDQGISVDYTAPIVRYHLGLVTDLTGNLRIEATPFVGIGFGFLDISVPEFEEYEPGLTVEYGLNLGLYANFGNVEIGGGGGYTNRQGLQRFVFEETTVVRLDVDQEYFCAFLTAGWRF